MPKHPVYDYESRRGVESPHGGKLRGLYVNTYNNEYSKRVDEDVVKKRFAGPMRVPVPKLTDLDRARQYAPIHTANRLNDMTVAKRRKLADEEYAFRAKRPAKKGRAE